jgi:hypothetical protein
MPITSKQGVWVEVHQVSKIIPVFPYAENITQNGILTQQNLKKSTELTVGKKHLDC